jgi:RNA recognition motif-containing protein
MTEVATGEGLSLAAERELLNKEWVLLRREKLDWAQDQKDNTPKLFVGNLDDASTEEDMRALFGPFGTVADCFMLKTSEGASKRSCFIKFENKADTDKAVAAINGKVTDKNSPKALVVRYAEKKQKPMGSTPGPYGAPPPPQRPRYPQQHQQGPYGYGQPQHGYPPQHPQQGYQHPQQGYRPPQQYGAPPQQGFPPQQGHHQGYGAHARPPAQAGGYGPQYGAGRRGGPGCNLYVNNIAFDAGEQEVRTMFEGYGTIISCKIFRGYGFVSFDNQGAAQSAIQSLNGVSMRPGAGGRVLEVSLKTEKGAKTARFSPY